MVRAGQKDGYYLGQLRGHLENVLRTALGTRWLAGNDDGVQLLTDGLYFGLTTVLGSRTLGEEYIDILQYSVKQRRLPTQAKRFLLVVGHVLLPYAVKRIWSATRQWAGSDGADNGGQTWLARLGSALPTYEQVFGTQLRALHLAVFYLTGRYYDFSKRLLGIRYILTRQLRPGEDEGSGSSYQVLGVLLLTQLMVRAIMGALRALRARSEGGGGGVEDGMDTAAGPPRTLVERPLPHRPGEANKEVETDLTMLDLSRLSAKDHASRQCILCLEERKSTTSADCGHLFCWECIVGWVRTRQECPLCRQSVLLQHLVPLYNL